MALGFSAQLRDHGFPVSLIQPCDYEVLPSSKRANFYRQSLGLLLHAVRSVLRRERDILIFYGGEAWLAIRLLTLLPRRLRPLVVVHSNGLEPHCAERLRAASESESKPPRRWYQLDLSALTALAFRHADGLVVVSEFEGAYARDRAWPRNGNLLVLENPLPSVFLGRQPSPNREPVLGFCGSWMHRKGVARLRREIPAFLLRNPEWRFRILGGSSADPSEEFPESVRARIEWRPAMDREVGLAREYGELAILVSPSIYESFGLVVAEGMACGCAVVATPVGFAAALKQREEALLCDAGRPGELAAALEEVARSPELLARLASRGSERVQGLDWQGAGGRLARALARWMDVK